MVRKDTSNRQPLTSRPGGLVGVVFRALLRTVLLVVALVVAGIYGQDLRTASEDRIHGDSRWVYAEVVAGLSAVTAIVYQLPFVPSWRLWFWDAVLFILWVALFGVFGKLYMHADCEGNDACHRMKVAMWFDMVGMILWFISALVGAALFFSHRHGRSVWTGRAAVV